MNKRTQVIVLVLGFISIVVMFYFTYLGTNQTKQSGTETSEREDWSVKHKVLFLNLPTTDIDGPFTLTYLYTKDGVDYVKVTDSSPRGRMNALHWLRQNGVDPTDINIQFDDFTNPLLGGV